ncbi:hypothetical protein [Bacillus sp. JCM 19041]|uniref:hypothetical protein n=1 Tax=Bacillus sp. JCM 19041 TaxID=1460637 RepID=UPI0012E25A4C
MIVRKRFGLDIDGTITDPATFVPYINKDFNKTLTLDDLSEYDLTKVLNISDKEFWGWMETNEPLIYSQAELALHAEQTLHKWSKLHDLIFITARRNHLTEVTTSWFSKQKLPYNHIELVGKHDKLDAVREHKLDVFFEDKHDNAVAIAEEFNIPVLLFDTPYNRLNSPNNVIRVANWTEANNWIDNWLHLNS